MTRRNFKIPRFLILALLALVIAPLVAWEPVLAQPEGEETEESPPSNEIPSNEEGEKTASEASTVSSEGGSDNPQQSQQESPRKPKEVMEDSFDASNRDWGSYYDPQNVFCGKYDCYKILGFDYDSFGKNPPDTKIITKRFRKLSREWHPDKSKHRDAKERFVKIARAYEVLTDVQVRKEYDAMRFDQEAYVRKYGTSVLWSYAPKSDVTLVMILIFIVANVAMWYSQQHRWQLVANRLIRAAVEDWSTAQGGTPESKDLRARALAMLQDQDSSPGGAANGETGENGKKGTGGVTKKQKGSKKLSGREKKKMEEEALQPIVKALVYEIDDFGGGFHKPTWRDLLAVTLAQAPMKLTLALIWNAKYYARRMQKLDLNEEERQVLTQRAVGPVVWDTKSEEERADMMKRELWKLPNLAEWEEEQQIKNLSSAEQKQYAKLKKKGKLE